LPIDRPLAGGTAVLGILDDVDEVELAEVSVEIDLPRD